MFHVFYFDFTFVSAGKKVPQVYQKDFTLTASLVTINRKIMIWTKSYVTSRSFWPIFLFFYPYFYRLQLPFIPCFRTTINLLIVFHQPLCNRKLYKLCNCCNIAATIDQKILTTWMLMKVIQALGFILALENFSMW